MTDRIPLVLKQDAWPHADQVAWDALFTEDDFLGDDGACCHWSEGSRRKRAQSYGQWLSFLSRVEPSSLQLAPAERVTRDRVERYLDECRARLQPRSISNVVGDLYEIARLLAPNSDWGWLRTGVRRLLADASTGSVPEAPPITAGRIFDWSLTRLAALQSDHSIPPRQKAIWFRQALMIGFLVARPVRRRALLAMRVDRHLKRKGGVIHLHFTAEDMKDKKTRFMPLPQGLVGHMEAYLAVHRPVLLGDVSSEFLWISQYGKPLTADGLSRELPKVTDRHLGVPLRPHHFRHVAATSIAEIDPEHVNVIRDVLGHSTLAMSEKHYNRATGISSCNALQSIVEDIRDDVPRMGRAKRHRRAMNGRLGD